MAEVTLKKRFRGTVRLITLHLWRVARSTDLEEGFAEALALGMLKPSHVSFIRECMALDEALESGDAAEGRISEDMVRELQADVLRLNTADPA